MCSYEFFGTILSVKFMYHLIGMARCPPGVVCTDWTTIILVGIIVVGGLVWYKQGTTKAQVVVVTQPSPPIQIQHQGQEHKPDVYAEPVTRYPIGLPTMLSRGPVGAYGQIGILTGEGGSSSSAAPDRTILPLYGREIDSRRGRWNYYTRTDGANPVQVPIRYKNRVCDDDLNGCDEIYTDESVHVPSLGRSFKSTVYKKSLFV
jgi:hypothetical protein